MPKTTPRQLRISSKYVSKSSPVPELRLSGNWFKELGFSIGETVRVTTREKLLVIEPIEAVSKEEVNYKEAIKEVKQTLKKLV